MFRVRLYDMRMGANPCSLHVMLYRTQKKKKREEETHLNEKSQTSCMGKYPNPNLSRIKSSSAVTFIATKNMKAKIT